MSDGFTILHAQTTPNDKLSRGGGRVSYEPGKADLPPPSAAAFCSARLYSCPVTVTIASVQ